MSKRRRGEDVPHEDLLWILDLAEPGDRCSIGNHAPSPGLQLVPRMMVQTDVVDGGVKEDSKWPQKEGSARFEIAVRKYFAFLYKDGGPPCEWQKQLIKKIREARKQPPSQKPPADPKGFQ